MAIAEGEKWQSGFDLDLFAKPVDGRVRAFVCTPEVMVIDYRLQNSSAGRLLPDSREVRVHRISGLRFRLRGNQDCPRFIGAGNLLNDLPACEQHSTSRQQNERLPSTKDGQILREATRAKIFQTS